MIDLAVHVTDKKVGRMFRESIRLKLTTVPKLAGVLARHRGQPGTRLLTDLTTRYGHIPYERTRSDAEGRGLEVLEDHGVELPAVNVKIGGEEADFVYFRDKRIIEIDGPQFHLFADEDARKQAIWEAHGFTVDRIGSDPVYNDPTQLVALARAA